MDILVFSQSLAAEKPLRLARWTGLRRFCRIAKGKSGDVLHDLASHFRLKTG